MLLRLLLPRHNGGWRRIWEARTLGTKDAKMQKDAHVASLAGMKRAPVDPACWLRLYRAGPGD